jgi:acyl dehydratase
METKLGPLELQPVKKLDLIKYAGASGDFNPIHTIDEEAQKNGLPGVIAHGMLTMAKMGTLFATYQDKGYIKEFSTRFKGMVFEHDVISIQATLQGKKDDNIYSYNVTAKNQKDKIVAEGDLDFAFL